MNFILLIPALYVGDIMGDLGITNVAVGNYVGFIMWACAAVVLFSGPIVSKLGAKRCFLIGAILMVVGMFLTAITPTNYILACLVRFLIGLGMTIATIASYPITMTWFTTEEYGKVNGALEGTAPFGILLCFTFVTIFFPRPLWREAHLYFAIPGLILVILWAILGRGPRVELKREEESFLHMLRIRLPKLLRIREIYLMGGLMWIALGVEMGFGTWVPSYLEWEWRWAPYAAAMVVSVNNVFNILSWEFGGILSDRTGLRRPFLIMGGPMVFLSLFMAFTFVGPMTWLWYALAGVCTAIYGFAVSTIVMEIPEMEPELIGTAISVVVLFGFISGAVMPTLMGAILDMTGSLYIGMFTGAALYLLVAIFGLLCRETGWKAAEKE